jgi:hypothetical protein
MNYPSLFEGIILLIISGIGIVGWWGVRRLVKTNDDGAIILAKINDALALICTRLGALDMWAQQHEKLDDERHREMKNVYQLVSNILIDRKPSQ